MRPESDLPRVAQALLIFHFSDHTAFTDRHEGETSRLFGELATIKLFLIHIPNMQAIIFTTDTDKPKRISVGCKPLACLTILDT